MATNNRTADVLLRWQVDTASVNRVRASFTGLENELDDLRAELTGVGTAAQQGVNGLRQRFAQGEQSVESMQDEVEQLRRELLALDDVKVTPTVDVQTTGGGGGVKGNAALNTVDRFGRFGTQISGAFGQAGGIGNAIGLVGDVADSFGTLGIAGGAAALAVGVVAIALNDLKASAERAAEAARAQIEGSRAAQGLEGAPRGDIEARRQAILSQIAFEEQSVAAREAEIAANDAYFASVQASNTIGATSVNLVYLGNDLTAASDTARVSINQSNAAIYGLTAEFKNLTAQLDATKGGLELVTKGFAEANAALSGNKGGTFSGGLAGINTPVDTKGPKAAAEAAAAALQKDQADAYLASITKTVQAQEDLTKAQDTYNEAVAASGARIAEINAKLQADLAASETDRQRDLTDAARAAGEERVKATEDAEKERARIQKRFDRSYSDAVAERDALAAKRAEDQKADELSELDNRYKDQLKTVDKSLAAQQRTIEARYQQQVATINAAAQAAVRTEQAAAQARLSALQQGVQAAQVALVNAQQSEFLIRANYYNQAVSQAQVWANLMQLYTSYGFSLGRVSGGSTGGGGSSGRVLPTPLADGGPAYASRPYLVGEQGPELFVPAQSGRIIPNGAALTINVTGAQNDTIRVISRQQALSTFGRVLDQMGVA
jgi:hypothetical protein